jgi:uncharacterized membrane protein
MAHPHALLFAFLIGVITGLRSLTGPAVTSWAAHLRWLDLAPSPVRFMSSIITVSIFTLLAFTELVADKLPSTPARTAPPGLIARLSMGVLSGATVASAGAGSLAIGGLLGAAGSLAAAFAGMEVRKRLVKSLGVPDFVIAVLEDVVAIGGGLLLLSRF